MNGKETKYRNTCNVKMTIIFSIILAVIAIVSIINIVCSDMMILKFISGIFLLMIIFSLVGLVSGISKGKKEIRLENKLIKNTNPYLYYRELPNTFGIGVASLLFDSTIENEKDIVAVILDLCAKKYLRLTKQNGRYLVEVLKPIDNHLLSNEKYVLSCIIYDNIKNINYKEWYDYCMQDGIDLGLYVRQEVKLKQNTPLSSTSILNIFKIDAIIGLVIGAILFLSFLIGSTNIFIAVICAFFGAVLAFLSLIAPSYLVLVILTITNVGKQVAEINYKNIKDNTLVKTKKGIEEVQKLYSFKAFIKDFGNFVDKSAEEVILWDYYLSYAHVFSLTKEIMKSGYDELIHNSSFQIDGIDDIQLNNVAKLS